LFSGGTAANKKKENEVSKKLQDENRRLENEIKVRLNLF